MATVNISPNMNLPVPVVSQDLGPDWATNITACMSGIDSHNHTAGQGVQITPNAININSDLPFGGNNATDVRTVRFDPQGAALSAPDDLTCVYAVNADLYYNDGAGNQVRITQGGSVTGSSGTITGLPSGTASASYAASTFTFQSATSTPAAMAVGPVSIGRIAASSKTVTLTPNAAQAADFGLTFPAALPSVTSFVTVDNTGGISFSNSLGTGFIPLGGVIGTFPNLSGAYSCSATTVADANGFVKCNGQTISDVTSPMNGAVIPNINNSVFLAGSTTAGSTGGAASVTLSTVNLPSHTHGAGSFATSLSGTFGSSTHVHQFPHVHQWAHQQSSNVYGLVTVDRSTTSITNSDDDIISNSFGSSGALAQFYRQGTDAGDCYTTGALDAPASSSGSTAQTSVPISTASLSGSNSVTGTSGSTGSGTSFSILPTYITTLYVMRIK